MKKDIKPSFAGALFVIIFLVVAMSTQIFILESNWTTHITLILVTTVAAVVALMSGFTWEDIQEGILYGCEIAMLPMLILMLVGVLIASWIAAGTIPTLIYYGLLVLSPKTFLLSVAIICSVASLATGSSWTTGATFGVAFMGIGAGLDIPAAMTAGAVISGSIFGDKMSPLSDSTNLAAGVAEADLFDHIQSMIYSTGPALLISLVLYYFLGLRFSASVIDQAKINIILDGLKNNFYVSPIAFIPPVLVIVLAVKKFSGLAVMIIAAIVGSAFAMIFQGFGLAEMLNFLQNGYVSDVGIAEIDALLSRGGLQSMMWTISLGFVALSFGGLLEKTRMLEVLLEKIKGLVKTTGGLVTTHVVSSIFVNIFSASQYMAIIIPGRMLVPVYKEKNILPQVASRVCEDSGTVTSPLIPWGLCGVYFAGVLGVPTMSYFPYVFLSFLAPAVTILLGVTDKFIFREGDITSVRTYSGENHEKVV
ncbi:MAG TPA: Na+/H+ antiporter NhaC [Clostridia bacterium]|nr:Na+/H+ antiporter NhaC [Clostridia bacterium]